jgi:hypothetical protein
MALTKPILMNSGKVKNNLSRDAKGEWNVSTGGFTEQFNVSVTPRRFRGQLHGFHFSACTLSEADGIYVTSPPHLWLLIDALGTGVSFVGYHANLNSGDPIRYEDRTTLDEDALTLLNTIAPTGYTFTRASDGDIVYDGGTGAENVRIGGLLPWVLGWGYLYKDSVPEQIIECQRYEYPGTNNSTAKWSFPYAKMARSYTSGEVETIYPQGDISDPNWLSSFVYIRKETDASLDRYEYLKNKSTFTYFYQLDLSTWSYAEVMGGRDLHKIPEDNDGNFRLYYQPLNDVEPKVGDKVRFARSTQMHFWITATGTSTSGIDYITVKDKENNGDYVDHEIANIPYVMGWCTGFKEEFETESEWTRQLDILLLASNSQEEIDGVYSSITGTQYDDPNEIIDPREAESKNLKKLLGDFLGDHTESAGIPGTIRQTTFWNCFTREDGSYELLDLDSLERIVKARGIEGLRYKLIIDYGEDENDIEAQEINVFELLNGICQTFGARMAWRYSETKRAWFVTFVPYFGESLAQVVFGSRVITDNDLSKPFVSGVAPGTWRYKGITATYKNQDDVDIVFNVKPRDGRSIAANSAEMLTISDTLTVIPPKQPCYNQFTRLFSDYMQEFSAETYTHHASLKMTKAAMIPVGMGIALESDSIITRETGRPYESAIELLTPKQYATVNSARYKWGRAPSLDLEMVTSTIERKGIGPAFFVAAANISNTNAVLTISAVTAIGLPVPAGYASGLPIIGYFGCWDFDEADGTIKARNCSCGNYGVTIWERNATQVTKVGASRNCWDGVLVQPTSTNVANGTCTISLNGGVDTNFDTVKTAGKGFIVKFSAVDASTMQPCQLTLYGHYGSSANRLSTTGGAATVSPIMIGG